MTIHSNERLAKSSFPRLVSAATLKLTRSAAAIDRALHRVALVAPAGLRISLGLIFLWFGALKLTGDFPVAGLVAATLPWGDPEVIVRVLGLVEVGLAIALFVGKARRVVLLILCAHLAGTLTFVVAPNLIMQNGNPFLLTADGEFVLKNLVLICAALMLATHGPHPTARTTTAP